MAAVFKTFNASGPAAALLTLVALLAAGARADGEYSITTTAECGAHTTLGRVRLYPMDSYAIGLYMNNCGLTRINPAEFTGLPKLEIIYLHDNKLEYINPAAFHTVPTLTNLILSCNKLRELPVFDKRSCANLTKLNLEINRLTVIDNAGTFSACAKLQRLFLSSNGIEFIHPNVFSALSDLRMLSLANNKIRLIPHQMFANNGKLEQLFLNKNLITHLPPDFASNLQRAGASLNTFHFNDNPWHCACLLELLADVQRAGVNNYNKELWNGITSTHYEGTLPECNYIGMREYPCSKIRELNFIIHGVR